MDGITVGPPWDARAKIGSPLLSRQHMYLPCSWVSIQGGVIHESPCVSFPNLSPAPSILPIGWHSIPSTTCLDLVLSDLPPFSLRVTSFVSCPPHVASCRTGLPSGSSSRNRRGGSRRSTLSLHFLLVRLEASPPHVFAPHPHPVRVGEALAEGGREGQLSNRCIPRPIRSRRLGRAIRVVGSPSFPNRDPPGSKGTVRPIKSKVKGRRKENVHTHVQSSTP